MAFEAPSAETYGGAWPVLASLTEVDGSAGHRVVTKLVEPRVAKRDLADAVHAICALHGRHLFEDAARERADAGITDWIDAITGGFPVERAYLARLTAAAGPLPSTPGQAEADAAFANQRHAFDMLVRSDRKGCASGAAIALVLDWRAFRAVLDGAATRFGIEAPACRLPDMNELAGLAAAIGDTPGVQRAIAFGAQQVFAQHRGLWDLLEARAIARDHHG
jgi:hypothetical protein